MSVSGVGRMRRTATKRVSVSLLHIMLIKNLLVGRADDVRAVLASGSPVGFLRPLQHILPHCNLKSCTLSHNQIRTKINSEAQYAAITEE